MTNVEAEATALEIANRLSDMLAALPVDALADAAEGQHRG